MSIGAEYGRLKIRSLQCKVPRVSPHFPTSPAVKEALLIKCKISMENWVGETRRNRIILIQCDIIKCRNQRLLVAQNLLEPWSGYLHFILTCCSLFTKTKLFQKGWKGDRDVHKSLGKKKVRKKILKTTLQQKVVPQKHPAKQKQKKSWQHWWWHYFEIFFLNCILTIIIFQATRRKFAFCKGDSRECLGSREFKAEINSWTSRCILCLSSSFCLFWWVWRRGNGMILHHPVVIGVAGCSSGICPGAH